MAAEIANTTKTLGALSSSTLNRRHSSTCTTTDQQIANNSSSSSPPHKQSSSGVTVATDDEKPLFSPSLISPQVASVLPTDYTVRPLRRSDYSRGYLDVLRVLTTVGDVSEKQWNGRYDWMASRADEYYLLVICDGTGRVVGTGSLLVERKFIHSLGMVGHIEDIAVEKGQQGKKLGLRIIQALDYVASHVGCYKVGFFHFHFPFLFYLFVCLSVCCRWKIHD